MTFTISMGRIFTTGDGIAHSSLDIQPIMGISTLPDGTIHSTIIITMAAITTTAERHQAKSPAAGLGGAATICLVFPAGDIRRRRQEVTTAEDINHHRLRCRHHHQTIIRRSERSQKPGARPRGEDHKED